MDSWMEGWMGDRLTYYLERWVDGQMNREAFKCMKCISHVVFGKVYRRPRQVCLLEK